MTIEKIRKVLIVDDFTAMRRILRNYLKQYGINSKDILEAENGKEAFGILKNAIVDVVFTDINMAQMDGLELLRAIKQDEVLKKLPVIMVTSEGQRQTVIEAIEGGASDYIVKPFTFEIVSNKLKRVCNRM